MGNWLNSIGLLFDIAGIIILFIFANPYRGIASCWSSHETALCDKEEENRLKNWQRFGLFLIGIGFLLQFVNSLGLNRIF